MKHQLQESIDLAVMNRLTEAHEELTALCGLINKSEPETATAHARLVSLTWSLGNVIDSLKNPTPMCNHRKVCVGSVGRGILKYRCEICNFEFDVDSSD